MDRIDVNLVNAWHRVAELCRRDPRQALKRYRRTRRPAVMHPMRAWCLCIRASDSRISPMNAAIDFPPGDEFVPAGIQLADMGDLLRHHLPHTLRLSGTLIRKLTQPVILPWPGVDWLQAAAMLGRHSECLRFWIKKGVLQVCGRYPALVFGRKSWRLAPQVWAPSPIDPNSIHGRAPDPVWGTLWQFLFERLPENYSVTVVRVPRVRQYARGRPETRFHGWSFICPGRMQLKTGDHVAAAYDPEAPFDPDRYEHVPCGRRVDRLYGPQSVWTFSKADLSLRIPLDMPRLNLRADCPPSRAGRRGPQNATHCVWGSRQGGGSNATAFGDSLNSPAPAPPPSRAGEHDSHLALAGQWLPGLNDPIRESGPRSFACRRCWQVRGITLTNDKGWNEFVTHLSGGLLYGHEVERPVEEVPYPVPQPRRRRDKGILDMRLNQVLAGLRRGLKHREIAAGLGLSVSVISDYTVKLYRRHNVHSRAELLARLAADAATANVAG